MRQNVVACSPARTEMSYRSGSLRLQVLLVRTCRRFRLPLQTALHHASPGPIERWRMATSKATTASSGMESD
jgi:hypothetical protein